MWSRRMKAATQWSVRRTPARVLDALRRLRRARAINPGRPQRLHSVFWRDLPGKPRCVLSLCGQAGGMARPSERDKRERVAWSESHGLSSDGHGAARSLAPAR